MKLNIAFLCAFLLLSLAFADCDSSYTQLYNGQNLTDQQYTVRMDEVVHNGVSPLSAGMTILYNGTELAHVHINSNSSYTFTNSNGDQISANICQTGNGIVQNAIFALVKINVTLSGQPYQAQPLPSGSCGGFTTLYPEENISTQGYDTEMIFVHNYSHTVNLRIQSNGQQLQDLFMGPYNRYTFINTNGDKITLEACQLHEDSALAAQWAQVNVSVTHGKKQPGPATTPLPLTTPSAIQASNLTLPFASAAECNTTVHVGDTLTAQGYSLRLDGISQAANGTAVGAISAYYGGFQIWGGQITETSTHSFTNPLDGTEMTITGCEAVPGADGYAKVAITGVNFTLVPKTPSPHTLPAPEPPGNATIPEGKNVSASLVIYASGSSNGQRLSLPLGEAVQAGDYSLKLVSAPTSETASVEVSDLQGTPIGTYDISTGSPYDVPVEPGASSLKLSLQTTSGAQGGATGVAAGAATGEMAGAPQAAQPPAAAPSQQSSQIQQLIAVLVIFVGMVIASFIVLYQLSRNQIGDPTMKLFENETRLGIVRQLAEADRIPTDLANSLDKSKAAVVEHLDILMSQGIVERLETPGKKFVFYRLTQKGKQALLRMAG